MSEIFPNIPKINYEGPKSKNPLAFKYYNPDEIILGKKMREHLKFSIAYWHTLTGDGTDMFGVGTMDKHFTEDAPAQIARKRVDALFELLDKLSIDYYCFHDRDIAPEGSSLQESNARLDEISDYLQEKQAQDGKACLWGTQNLFSNPRYMHGAGTAPNLDVFVFAAGQIKKNIDITIKLAGKGIVFWGGREGYETLLNTDMAFELENMAHLLRMAVNYARSQGFSGDFYIEPKPKEPTKHQYDFDASTVIAFLKKFGLEKDFKLNIEANHATLAGHTFQHELRVARDNGMLGSIDANQGDLLLGWDTDQFPTDVYSTTLCMYEVIKDGGFKNGGLNFDAKARRGSFTHEDIFLSFIAGMDAFALGFLTAEKLIEDGRIDDFVRERYSSWNSETGKKIREGQLDLKSLSDMALAMGEVATNISGKQEYLETVLNQVLFSK
ncbi:MAG: xylose isomerase [Anaerolineaceae bacterium]|nr:xylose isomerase [Anaerolineaceae bacterium]